MCKFSFNQLLILRSLDFLEGDNRDLISDGMIKFIGIVGSDGPLIVVVIGSIYSRIEICDLMRMLSLRLSLKLYILKLKILIEAWL